SSLRLLPRPPLSTLFPYPTLFRSPPPHGQTFCRECFSDAPFVPDSVATAAPPLRPVFRPRGQCEHDGKKNYDDRFGHEILAAPRSEEHTSELQSRGHLVCRLLLEK